MDLPPEMGHADIVLNFLQPTLLCFSILCIHIRVKSIPYLLLLKAELYGLDNREEWFKREGKKKRELILHIAAHLANSETISYIC